MAWFFLLEEWTDSVNRKLKIFIICFSFIVLASHAFAEVNLANLVKEIQPSIVTVITYDKKGHLITNYHVLQGAYTAEIKTYDGNTYPEPFYSKTKTSDLIWIPMRR